MAAATGIDIKRNCVEVLLALLTASPNGDAALLSLRTVLEWARLRRIDESLLRCFVSEVRRLPPPPPAAILSRGHRWQVASTVGPPFSAGFVRVFASVVETAAASAALRGRHASAERGNVNRCALSRLSRRALSSFLPTHRRVHTPEGPHTGWCSRRRWLAEVREEFGAERSAELGALGLLADMRP